ncbi:MAG: chemotaxis protein CheX [Bdellovibrionales bacterium]|nr:chemotaxis protein CheX [Bdellovibrionales bacterium]NQZ18807.1 chemotaxis protein CheX [Bdellovibrionales bacterium]
MGAIDLSKSEAYFECPKDIDRQFVNSMSEQLNDFEGITQVTFDFKQTKSVDRSFYAFIHQVKQKMKQNQGRLISVGIHSSLKSVLINDGVYQMFNFTQPNAKSSKPNKRLQVDFIHPFVDSTREMLDVQAGVKAEAGKPYIKMDGNEFDIIGVISLGSEVFEGSIILCFKKDVFLNICSSMMMEEFKEINEELEDAAGEMLNIIFGMAKAKLNNEKGYKIEKAIPTIIRGPGIRVKQTQGPKVILPFTSDAGNFHIEIELSESKEG